jgi:hypothetical protein
VKEPRPVISSEECPVIGLKLIVPVELEGYDRGYDSIVEDEYEPQYLVREGKVVGKRWIWTRRVRVFTRPWHDDEDGPCEECEKWHALYPERPENEILMEAERERL